MARSAPMVMGRVLGVHSRVLKALQQQGNLVPVILLTTFDDPQVLKEGISAGPDPAARGRWAFQLGDRSASASPWAPSRITSRTCCETRCSRPNTRRGQADLRADALKRPCGQMSRSSAPVPVPILYTILTTRVVRSDPPAQRFG